MKYEHLLKTITQDPEKTQNKWSWIYEDINIKLNISFTPRKNYYAWQLKASVIFSRFFF